MEPDKSDASIPIQLQTFIQQLPEALQKPWPAWSWKLIVRIFTDYFPTLRSQLKPLLDCIEKKVKGNEGYPVVPPRIWGRLCGHLQVLTFYLEQIWPQQLQSLDPALYENPDLRLAFQNLLKAQIHLIKGR